MASTVKSASSALVAYGYEAAFGGGTTQTRMFGKEQKTNSLEYNNSQQALGELYTPEVQSFLYKKEYGGCTMEYILSNPWVFAFILNDPKFTAGTPNVHEWDSDPDYVKTGANQISTRQVCSGHLEIFTEGSVADVDRNAKGVICPSMNIKTTIDAPVKVTMPLVWGIEDTVATTIGAAAPLTTAAPITDAFPPYTFVHGSIKTPVSGGFIGQVQELDITLDTGAELLYQIQNSAKASGAWRKLLNMTGRISVATYDKTPFERVQLRTEVADMELKFTNGLGAGAEKSITLLFTGIGFSKMTAQGLAPGELLLDISDFQCRQLHITAKNDTADQFV